MLSHGLTLKPSKTIGNDLVDDHAPIRGSILCRESHECLEHRRGILKDAEGLTNEHVLFNLRRAAKALEGQCEKGFQHTYTDYLGHGRQSIGAPSESAGQWPETR